MSASDRIPKADIKLHTSDYRRAVKNKSGERRTGILKQDGILKLDLAGGE